MNQSREYDWTWFTCSRVRVLRELADNRSEREAADRIGVGYSTIRSVVSDIKAQTGLSSVREISRWWRSHRLQWLEWHAELGGVLENQDAS